MIKMVKVTQFMHDDVVDDTQRCHHALPVKARVLIKSINTALIFLIRSFGLNLSQDYAILAKMKTKGYIGVVPQPEEVDAIPATEMKNAHGKRLPKILKTKGFAKVTRYGKPEYYMLSPKKFDEMAKHTIRPENPKLKALREEYRELVDSKMQAAQNQHAFAALSRASDDELGSATSVGAAELATH